MRRGARIGAAAVALGFSLAGPQHIAIAAADSDTDSAAASGATDQNAGPSSVNPSRAGAATRARAAKPVRHGTSEDSTGGADASTAGATTTGGGSNPPRPAASVRPRKDSPNDSPAPSGPLPAATQPSGATSPQSNTPGAPTAGLPTPTASATAAAAPATEPSAARRARGLAAPKPVAAQPVIGSAAVAADVMTAMTSFFDSATHWLSGLPASPVTNFLQGALLLVRRALLNPGPGSGSGQTGGQTGTGSGATTGTSTYFTEQELRDYLLALAKQRYGGMFGQTLPHYNYLYMLGGRPVAINDATGGGIKSDTNTQVNGVDEADFVETDGNYLYVARNGKLTILGADSAITSETTLRDNVVGAFLSGDRLTVITQTGFGGWYGPMVRMAYGPWWDWNPQTRVTVFDVSDRSAPTVASETLYDGSLHDARAVDGKVYLVLDRAIDLPEPLYTAVPGPDAGGWSDLVLGSSGDARRFAKPIRWDGDGPSVSGYRTYETWDEYAARVGDDIVSASLPHAFTVAPDGTLVDLGVVVDAADIVRPGADDRQSVVTVVSIDSLNASPGSGFADSVAGLVATNGNAIYMTPDALYVATSEGDYSEFVSTTNTRIDRFAIDGLDLAWQASGVVPGTLINQFAMDEYNGYLNVATHTWASSWTPTADGGVGTWSTRNESGVYTLDTTGNVLDEVGRLTGLAPGEQLFAVRFVGDMAYLVTFLQTDPLFAIDRSDPTAPTLQGELVIPGFSNYLQPVGDGLLLGIGQEREPGTWNSRLHVSLFDVTDATNPIQIERQFLDEGAQWSSSDAQYDHHALLYSAEDGLLVVPMLSSGYDSTGNYTYKQTLKVMRVDASGIEVLGEIQTDEPVIRTARIGDVLYAVTDSNVTAYRLSDLSEVGRA